MLPPFDPDFATVADHARYYRSIGWQAIPGYNPRPKADDPGQRWKAPALPSWRTLQAELVDDATFEGFFGPSTRYARPDATNLGILTGECSGRLVVIDLDSYKGPEAMQWWRGLTAVHNNGMELETVSQVTGGGGLQLVFRAPPGWMCSIGTSSLNVDVRGHGGFFVVAPSLHDSGAAYRWQEGCAPWEIEVADMPEWLCGAVDTLLRDFSRKAPGSPSAPRGEHTPTPDAAMSPFGKATDGREAIMTRHVWGHVVALRRDAPMKPIGEPLAEAERDGFAGYVRKVKSRLPPSGEAPEALLEREGRGWSLWREKWAYALDQWDTKVREEADKPHPKPAGHDAGPIPRHDPETGEILEDEFAAASPADPPFRLTDWTATRYAGAAPEIRWLVEGSIPLGVPVILAAMGGLGKSYLMLDLALRVATGMSTIAPSPIMGGQVVAHGTAVMLAAEDSTEAIHRRFNRMDPEGKRMIAPERLIVVPMASAGGARQLIASDGKNLSRTPFFHDLKAQLKAIPDFRLGILDPLQAMAMADVNADPAAAQFFWSAIAELAAETGGTFIIPHHMRKDGMNKISTGADAREGIRGTTALVDGARLAYVLWAVGKDDAEAICTSLEIDHEEGKIVRGAVVKSNDEADFSTHTYVRQESGLLVQLAHDPEPATTPAMATSTAHAILKDAEERWQAGVPYSERAQAGSRYIVHVIMRTLDCNRKGAVSILNQWIKNGVVRSEMRDNKSKMYGLRVLFYPG